MFRTALAAIVVLAIPAAAQQRTADEVTKVDRIVTGALASTQVPAASVAVGHDGRIEQFMVTPAS